MSFPTPLMPPPSDLPFESDSKRPDRAEEKWSTTSSGVVVGEEKRRVPRLRERDVQKRSAEKRTDYGEQKSVSTPPPPAPPSPIASRLPVSSSPSSSASPPASLEPLSAPRATSDDIVGGQSIAACIERFLLCEHTNSINILLYMATIALFASSSLSRRVGLFPAQTTPFHFAYRWVVVVGLVMQMVFELKNTDCVTWSRPARARNTLPRPSSAVAAFTTAGPSYLSPSPIAATRTGYFVMQSAQSNLTVFDRRMESVGSSLIMFAMNQLMLQAFFLRNAASLRGGSMQLPTTLITNFYSMCNVTGVLASVKHLLVSIFSRRRLDPSQADPPRSLPLILPSLSFIQATHALFLRPPAADSPSRASSAAVGSVDGLASSALGGSAGSSAPVLRVMATLSLYYWSLHNKHVTNGYAPSCAHPDPFVLHGPSPLLGRVYMPARRLWRWNSQLGHNLKLVAGLMLVTKEMA